MTEKEKMLAGEVYSAVDPELIEELMATRVVLYEYNSLRPSETSRMKDILKGLLGYVADDEFLINQPFHCDYGKQISIGKRFFANYLLSENLWDGKPITIEQGGNDRIFNSVKLKCQDGKVLFGGKATKKIEGEYYI